MRETKRIRNARASLATTGGLLVAVAALGTASCTGDDSSVAPPPGTDASTSVDGSARPDAGSTPDASEGSPDKGSDAGSDAGAVTDGGPMAVNITFKAKVGTQAFACGTTYPGQGATAVSVQPQDFRFYVQDLRLVDDQGHDVAVTLDTRSPWQTPDVALLDFEDGKGACVAEGNVDLNAVITGTAPAGNYTGIAFRNGIPEALDHADPLVAPPPLQPAPMTWGWLYGYKFIKAEMAATAAASGDAAPGLGLLHLGSVGCTQTDDSGAPDAGIVCTNPDRTDVRLPGYRLGKSVIVADVGAIFQGTDLSQDNQCHSGGPACPSMFAAVGVDLTTGQPLATQSIYRLE